MATLFGLAVATGSTKNTVESEGSVCWIETVRITSMSSTAFESSRSCLSRRVTSLIVGCRDILLPLKSHFGIALGSSNPAEPPSNAERNLDSAGGTFLSGTNRANSALILSTLQCISFRRHITTNPVTCRPSMQWMYTGRESKDISDSTRSVIPSGVRAMASLYLGTFFQMIFAPIFSANFLRSEVGFSGIRDIIVRSFKGNRNGKFLRVGYAPRYTLFSISSKRKGGIAAIYRARCTRVPPRC
mmetsp:Transcript_10183/g.19559  ORF Transcript_10183/g.19559 Transcript_10183/m.19559 type:complete len:244 (-) Transcript_10183:18-749(-)